MARKQLLALFVFLSFATAAWAANSGCGTANEVCQGDLISPPSLEPSQSAPRVQDPDASALAPMPPADYSSSVKSGPEVHPALIKNHDNDLIGSADKTEVSKDPFALDSSQRLHITPE